MSDVISERDEAEHTEASTGVPYVLALVGLLGLTALSFGLHNVPLGSAGAVIALSIGAAKIAIVGAALMELREWNRGCRRVPLVTA